MSMSTARKLEELNDLHDEIELYIILHDIKENLLKQGVSSDVMIGSFHCVWLNKDTIKIVGAWMIDDIPSERRKTYRKRGARTIGLLQLHPPIKIHKPSLTLINFMKPM